MIKGRSPAAVLPQTAVDDLHDLDATPETDDADGGSGRPPRRLRRRLLAVGVLAVAALLGAALGTAHANARAAQAEQELRLDTALRTGQVSLGASVSTADHLRLVSATVPLVTTGTQAVIVRLVALDAPHLGELHLPGASAEAPVPETVAPGSALSVQAAAEVRCADVPRQDPYGQPPATAPEPAAVVVDVSLADGGPTRRVRLPLAADEALQLASQLTWACHPDVGPSLQTSYSWRPDGGLSVDLRNAPAPGAPVRITARTAGGVEVASSPPLPLVLQPGASGWLTRQIALRCG